MKKPGIILASAAVGICQALPGAFDLAGAIQSAGRGALGGTWPDRLVSAACRAGGWGFAEFVRSAWFAVPWFLGFLVLFFAAGKCTARWRRPAVIFVWLLWCAAAFVGLWNAGIARRDRIDDPRLLAPLGLIESVNGHAQHVLINPSALPLVAAWEPGLVDREVVRGTPLVQSPARWREEDRKHPFSAVLLGGSLSEAKPLILHLLDSPDWHLAAVDNQGLLFLRGDKQDRSEAEIPVFQSSRGRALYLAQYALCLDAAGLKDRATLRMNEAMEIAENDFEILVRATSLAASRSRWEQARKLAAKARMKRPGAFEADYLLAWSLLETRAFDKAFEMTSQLAGKHSNNFSVLLLHARACRASKNFSSETAVLEELLRLAGEDKLAASRIHLFLGQSWTQRGFPDQAIAHYKQALEGNPAPAEVRDIREAIQTIEASRLKTAP